jgi:ectoine hydroxylase-related dioxygenase (phytanoyl-CoA dioxygenase family)
MDAEVTVCRLKAGSVTFHHSKTPHMTTGNTSDAWRLTLAQHFWNPACKGKRDDNYNWRVLVNQRTNERVHEANGVVERV